LDADVVRVLVVEDHTLLAQSVAVALTIEGFDVFRPEHLDADAILAAAVAHRPGVVLLDLSLEDAVSALPLIPPLCDLGAAVVVVTGVTDRVRLAECVEAGALGIVGKHESFEALIAAVSEAAQLRALLSTGQREDLLQELRHHRADTTRRLEPFGRLTRREREVLRSLVDGESAEVIAKQSFVSVATVRSQIRSVLSKLGVNSQLAAVALATRGRWPL
jgi:two-component system nitrate/nitrite response regulator NarL